MGKEPANVVEASRAVAALPPGQTVELPDGRRVEVRRLNWLQFELLWTEMAGLLALLASDGQGADETQLAAELASAPQFVFKLAQLASGHGERELVQWQYDDVLAVAAAAIELNFSQSAGLRSFFLAASGLLGQDNAALACRATRQPSTS